MLKKSFFIYLQKMKSHLMKNIFLVFMLNLAVHAQAFDNNKDVLKMPVKEHIKLLPQYQSGESKRYKITSVKRELDSLGIMRLKDTIAAEVEITCETKVQNGYVLKWKFHHFFRDTSLLSVAEKPSNMAMMAAIAKEVFLIKLDKNASFEEVLNEDDITKTMDKNSQAEKEMKNKLASSKNKKSGEMTDMMIDLMRYKVLEKGLYPIFQNFSTLYGHTYIQDSTVSMKALEEQAMEGVETDALSQLLAKSLSGGMEKKGGASMQLLPADKTIQVQLHSEMDMSELMNSMSGLFSGLVTGLAEGLTDAFDTDTATTPEAKEQKAVEKENQKKDMKKGMEAVMKDMKMLVMQNANGTFDYKNKQIKKLYQEKIVDGFLEGKKQYEVDAMQMELME